MDTIDENCGSRARRQVTVWVQGSNEPLYGHLIAGGAESEGLIELQPGAAEALKLAPSTTLRIVTFDARGYRIHTCRIRSVDGCRVKISLSTPAPAKTERRSHQCVSCDLPCSFRAMHADGHVGAWQPGTVVDLSIAGAGLQILGIADVPKRIEISFAPPSTGSGAAARSYGDEGTEFVYTAGAGDPIRATANVAGVRVTAEGMLIANCSFCNISAKHRSILDAFLMDAAKAA